MLVPKERAKSGSWPQKRAQPPAGRSVDESRPIVKIPAKMAVNINQASAQELDNVADLEGHGFEIVRYRQERGSFTELRHLAEVPGLASRTGFDELGLAV